MKKLFLMSTIIVSSLGIVNAQAAQVASQAKATEANQQNQRTPEMRAQIKVAQITKSGILQSNQIDKINKLYIEFYTKQDALRTNQAKLNTSEFQKQMDELKSQNNAAIKAVLTPEQVKTFELAEQRKQERNVAGRPGN